MSIFVVRHAETDDNFKRIVQTPAAHLSAAGQNQARMLARRLEMMGIVRIITSDLVRAAETAAYAGVQIGVEPEFEPSLRERDFGDLRGSNYSALTVDPFAPNYTPPGGESWLAFHERVALAWQRIIDVALASHGNLLVVTHGLVCRSLAERQLTLLPGNGLPARWDNTSVTEVDAASPWIVRRVNCTAHLTSEGLPAKYSLLGIVRKKHL